MPKVFWLPCLLLGAAAFAEKPKLAVLDFTRAGEVEDAIVTVLNESVATELSRQGTFDVITAREIASLLGVERQKQLLGCADDSTSCIAELGGALGAKLILSGSVAKLGDAYQLNLQCLDTVTGQVVGRSSFVASAIEELRNGLPFLVARATNTPPPAVPSRVRGFLLLGSGALIVAVGGLYGLGAASQETQLSKELTLGESAPIVLKSQAYYRDEAERLSREKTISIVGMGIGVGLIIWGYLWLPKVSGAAAQASIVPTPNGFAVVGAW